MKMNSSMNLDYSGKYDDSQLQDYSIDSEGLDILNLKNSKNFSKSLQPPRKHAQKKKVRFFDQDPEEVERFDSTNKSGGSQISIEMRQTQTKYESELSIENES